MNKRQRDLSTLTAIVLLLAIISVVAVSGTYAKYTTEVTGTATAIIAKWDVNFKNGENELTDNFTIDLADSCEADCLVTVGESTHKIQPGSKGVIWIETINGSEVPATVSATVDTNESSILSTDQFSITSTKIYESKDTTSNEIEEIAAGSTAYVAISWEWVYEATSSATDADDITVGTSSTYTATAQTLVDISITATQVDPHADK